MADCTCANPQLVAQALQGEPGKGNTGQKATDSSSNVTQATDNIHKDIYGESIGGKPGSTFPTRFCHWVPTQYGVQGEWYWTAAFEAAGLAIAIANGLAQQEIADMQQELADSYYQMAKYKWDRFAGKYMPLEKQLLAEVSSEPIRQLNCADAKTRAQAQVNTAYTAIEKYMSQQTKKYRLCLDDASLANVNLKQSIALVDTENYNLGDDRWYTDYKNDQRWNRRSNVLNLGRNLSSMAMQYGDAANAILKNLGPQLDKIAGGVMQALGYYGAKFDTYYPTTFLEQNTGRIIGIGQNTNATQLSEGAAGTPKP